jgi:hypothetical protein
MVNGPVNGWLMAFWLMTVKELMETRNARTGLAKATVNGLVKELMRQWLIEGVLIEYPPLTNRH